jgi:hypothetical protein
MLESVLAHGVYKMGKIDTMGSHLNRQFSEDSRPLPAPKRSAGRSLKKERYNRSDLYSGSRMITSVRYGLFVWPLPFYTTA